MNKVILMGRLTANPELKHTQNNLPVVNFTLAVNRPYVKQGQERQADFIDIVCWRSTAEFVSRYFTKGQQVAVCGSLQVRNWQDQQGNKRRSYEGGGRRRLLCRFQAGTVGPPRPMPAHRRPPRLPPQHRLPTALPPPILKLLPRTTVCPSKRQPRHERIPTHAVNRPRFPGSLFKEETPA